MADVVLYALLTLSALLGIVWYIDKYRETRTPKHSQK